MENPDCYKEISDLLWKIRNRFNAIHKIKAELEQRISALTKEACEEISVNEELINNAFTKLHEFSEEHKLKITSGGKIKTIKLPAGELRWRSGRESVKIKDDDLAVKELEERGLNHLVVIEKRPNKAAILTNKKQVQGLPSINILQVPYFEAAIPEIQMAIRQQDNQVTIRKMDTSKKK